VTSLRLLDAIGATVVTVMVESRLRHLSLEGFRT
jgi:hypothetical protein